MVITVLYDVDIRRKRGPPKMLEIQVYLNTTIEHRFYKCFRGDTLFVGPKIPYRFVKGDKVSDILENTFILLNAPLEVIENEDARYWATQYWTVMRSLSCGDVIRVEDEFYAIEFVGFRKIENKPTILGSNYWM